MVLGEEHKGGESGGVCRGFVGGSVVFFWVQWQGVPSLRVYRFI